MPSKKQFQFTFEEDGDHGVSIKENVTDYRVYWSRCARATAIMTYDYPNLGLLKQDVEWFSGVDADDQGNVSYYFGVNYTVYHIECLSCFI